MTSTSGCLTRSHPLQASAAVSDGGRRVCVGETMALVVPGAGAALESSERFQVTQAGAESNVAVGLAALGTSVSWSSRVGDEPLGRRILAELRRRGVDTRLVAADRDRPTGVMFKDPGNEGSSVYYYRAGSAAGALAPGDADRIIGTAPVNGSG